MLGCRNATRKCKYTGMTKLGRWRDGGWDGEMCVCVCGVGVTVVETIVLLISE